MKKFIVSVVLFSLIGAGCGPAPKAPQGQKAVPAQMGFGKLPSLGATAQLGSPEAISARPASPAPMVASGNAVMVEGSGGVSAVVSDMMIARPIPRPPQLKPVNVKYNLIAALPTLPTDGDVLEVARAGIDASVARGVMSGAGLPSQLVSGVKDILSIQTSWISTDGYNWTADMANHSLNFWKYEPQIKPMADDMARPENKPTFTMPEDAKIIAVSDAFLRSHGLGYIVDQGATVYRYDSRPCVMMEGLEYAPAPTDTDVKTMIYPSPCDTSYVPQLVDVFYGTMREGRTVVDMSGFPARYTSVGVDIKDMRVSHGNVPFSENIRRSSYVLLDQATALERLKAGGRNPVYPWGGETKDIVVTINKIELAWLRYDSYADGKQQTYYLPAITASGTVDRGIKGQEKEEYYTTVALVKDDAFEEVGPQPVPMPYGKVVPMMEGGVSSPSAPVKY